MEQKWIQVRVICKSRDVDSVVPIMSLIDESLMIEDYSDFSLDGMYGNLVDERILSADKTHASVSLFVKSDTDIPSLLGSLDKQFKSAGIDALLETKKLDAEDWENSYKKYYSPISLGRISLIPIWQKNEYRLSDGEIPLYIDPGMAFGTGAHETTRLAIRLLDRHLKPGDSVLDVGTGSGILSICAAKLGAESVFACDLDPVSVAAARKNIADSGVTQVVCEASDLLSGVKRRSGGYRIVIANIVADVLKRMNPDVGAYLSADGIYILSGIVSARETDVTSSLERNGFEVVERMTENEWVALAARKC